ncbi:MAG: hypothetical protein CM15mP12_7160 [Gammaproteobacteria bacterium]|nr:MAG: hypothetical protein CM15mP12_7160 [Gammaproteobacteria bacterium]
MVLIISIQKMNLLLIKLHSLNTVSTIHIDRLTSIPLERSLSKNIEAFPTSFAVMFLQEGFFSVFFQHRFKPFNT